MCFECIHTGWGNKFIMQIGTHPALGTTLNNTQSRRISHCLLTNELMGSMTV